MQQVLARLARTDIQVSLLSLAILFGGLIALPNSWFWYWFIPLAVFYVRMHYVIMRREQAVTEAMRAELHAPQ